jgi:hypothetical protein
LALAAAEAIKRLIAKRNALRSCVTVLERELLRLRHHFTLIRDSYRKLAIDLITQLQLVVARSLKHPVDRQNCIGFVANSGRPILRSLA